MKPKRDSNLIHTHVGTKEVFSEVMLRVLSYRGSTSLALLVTVMAKHTENPYIQSMSMKSITRLLRILHKNYTFELQKVAMELKRCKHQLFFSG